MILFILCVILVLIVTFLKENIGLAIFLGAVALVVIFILYSKVKKKEEAERVAVVTKEAKERAEAKKREEVRTRAIENFYSRTRWREVINATGFLDEKLTAKIMDSNIFNATILSYNEIDEKYKLFYQTSVEMFNSIEVLDWSLKVRCDASENIDSSYQDAILSKFNIQVQGCSPIIISSQNYEKRGLKLYILPNTVLVFCCGEEKNEFIAAYNLGALSINHSIHDCYKKVAIGDREWDVADAYAETNPIKDAEIHKMFWTAQNKDGKRSRRGSILAEHNPLNIVLKYRRISWQIGEYALDHVFSNGEKAKEMVANYRVYKKAKINEVVQPACVETTVDGEKEQEDND